MPVEPLVKVLGRDSVDRRPGRMERAEVAAAYRTQDRVVAHVGELGACLRRQWSRHDDLSVTPVGAVNHSALRAPDDRAGATRSPWLSEPRSAANVAPFRSHEVNGDH